MKLVRSLKGFGVVLGLAGAVTLGTAVAGCGGPGAKTAKVTPGDMPSGESWTGVYFHPVYGYLHMEEQDSNVRGKWKRADQSAWGELSGTKTGNVLHYTWKEYKSGVVAGAQHGKGYFVYVHKPDAEIVELKGEYGLGSDETGSEWNCTKQLRMTPDLKSIGGDTGSSVPTTGGLD
jgi:hypothetical protein